jgi:hypothetical protein
MRTRIDPKPILLAALMGEQIPPGRKVGVVYSRFIFANHLRLQRKNQEEIGAEMNRDRSTISYYLRKYDEEYEFNPEFREFADWFNQIKEQL